MQLNGLLTPLVGRVPDSFAWCYVYSEFCFLGNCIFLHSTCLVLSTAHALRSARLVLQGTGFLWHWYQKVSNDPSWNTDQGVHTRVRVRAVKRHVRSESNSFNFRCRNNRLQFSERGLSVSTPVGTRKMVNYIWGGWSQGKPWWRLVAILTCKSFVTLGHRGERLIELSSSWFPSKFPSG